MKRSKIWCAAILVGMIFPLSACEETITVSNAQIIFTTGLTDRQVFRVGGEVCSLAEASLLLAVTKNRYEESFGKEIWQQKAADIEMEDYMKNMVKNQLLQLKYMYLYSQTEGITLSEDETTLVLEASADYYESLKDTEIETLELSQALIEAMFQEYALSQKVYAVKTRGVDQEISDSEAKVIVIQHIFKDTNGKSDAEKKVMADQMSGYLEQLTQGADFSAMALEFSDDKQIEYAFGRGEFEQNFEAAAFSLTQGEISKIIETSSGYHILKCISDYEVDFTERNKKKILENRKQEMFQNGFSQFTEELLPEVNDKLWNSISLERFDGISVHTLFEEYEQIIQ